MPAGPLGPCSPMPGGPYVNNKLKLNKILVNVKIKKKLAKSSCTVIILTGGPCNPCGPGLPSPSSPLSPIKYATKKNQLFY